MADEQAEKALEELVRWELADGVGRLTINQPETKNALTWDMRDRVAELLEAASGDLNVRVVVISGEGGAFCAGANLRKPQPMSPKPEGAPRFTAGDVTRLLQSGWQRVARAIIDCHKPVIAAVDGVAAGGGAQLALACDLVLASDRSKLVEVFVKRGIVPDAGAAWVVTRLLGPQKTKELFFFGDSVPASDFERLGIANRVVPADELPGLVDDWAKRLAASPTVAIGAAKRLVNTAFESDLNTGLMDEAVNQELVQGSHDAQEGVAAFRERRDPDFKGY